MNMRMVIIDEVSFLDHDVHLKKISNNLQMFTECRQFKYGKRPVIFLGDFRQLPPVGGNGILLCPNSQYWSEAINCVVELKGTHRFNNCEHMKEIMPALHKFGLSPKHREMLNSRVIDGNSVVYPDVDKTRVAVYHNRLRSEHNRATFREYLNQVHRNCDVNNIPKSALVIKSRVSWGKTNQALNPTFRKVLFEYCTDAHITTSRNEKCDPFLTLIQGCPVMGTVNQNVAAGVANGTCATFERAIFKPGKSAYPIKIYGDWVYAIDIDDVDHLILRWTDSQYRGTFHVKPKKAHFTAKFPIWDEFGKMTRLPQSLQITHFPLLINYATTGHKLQGKSVDTLVIAEWSTAENWAYVVLSRVKSLEGLFLLEPIPWDIDFTPSQQYTEMLQTLQNALCRTNDVNVLYSAI